MSGLPLSQRLRAPIPEHCVTRLALRVRFGETDLMGIVHHGSYVGYLEAGRIEYLRRRRFPYPMMIERGLHMPVVDIGLRYKRPARFDDLIVVETRLGALTRVTVRFEYAIHLAGARERPAADGLLSTGHTLLACVDDQNRPRPLPDDILAFVLSAEAGDDSGAAAKVAQ